MTIDLVMASAIKAATAFVKLANQILNCYDQELAMIGINVSHEKGSVSITLFADQTDDSREDV